MHALHVIQNPKGTWSFVGKVPRVLAYETSAKGTLYDYLMNTAQQCGPGLAEKIAAKEGHTFKTRTWRTREGAIDAAVAAGWQTHLAEDSQPA